LVKLPQELLEVNSMATELRKTGINVIGNIPWGTHFCHFYETKEDLLHILTPYFKAGLENNEFCMWVVSDPLGEEEAREALRLTVPEAEQHLEAGRIEIVPHTYFLQPSSQETSPSGQIEIVQHTDWYLKGGAFDLDRVISGWSEKLAVALAKGYAGMRANGNEAWLTKGDWKDFAQYEQKLNETLANQAMIVLCSYPLDDIGAAEIFDVVNNHEFAIVRRDRSWEVVESPDVKEAKAEITRLNEELEQRVIERTKKLEETTERLRAEIEDRKEAEEALRQSEERFVAFMDNLPGYAWMKDLQGRYVYVNEMVRGLPGYRSLGKTDAQIWPADLAAEYRANDQQVMAAKKPLHTLEHYQQEGKQRYMAGSKFPIFDKTGAVALVGGVGVDITERIEAEAALRENEAKLKQAQQLANIGYWERDLIADRITWSEETGHLLGLESYRGVLNKAQLREFIHPDDWQHHQQVLNEALQGSRLFDVEVRFMRPDGNIRFVHIRDEIVRDESGKPILMFGAVQDVTERRRAEEAVRRSEEHLRLVIDTIPTMAWTGRPDGVVDFLNQRWLDYAGLSLEEYVNDPTGPIHPEDIPRVMEKWLAEMAVGEGYEDEMRLRRADGEYHWFLVRTEPLRDEQGNIVKWYGSSVDIEDRKQAEEALRKSERVLRGAESLGHTGSWEHNLVTGEMFNTGENLRLFFGDDRSKGASFEDYTQAMHPDDRELVIRRRAQLLAEGGPRDIEFRVVWPDGSVHVLFGRATVVRDELGQAIRTHGTNLDITERKQAEEQLKATSEQLRALSESLRKAKEEEGIRIARELHDELGSTLTSLKWSLLGLDQVKTSQRVSNENEKIAEMVGLVDSTINTVRRISSELRPGVLDDLGLVSAIEWHAHQFEHNTGIVCHFESNAEDVDLDREHATTVFRIFQEAMTNILRHAQATEVKILIEEEEGEFVLEVKDNGRGITEGEKLGTRSLGLLGMRERAHSLGGTVEISSAAGKGTVVTVRLPKRSQISRPAQRSLEVTTTASSSLSRKEKS
jgi:PAS domain S-box-containing protein